MPISLLVADVPGPSSIAPRVRATCGVGNDLPKSDEDAR
jgi:hypothetical protein